MPRDITPADVFTTTVQISDDGEDADSASLGLTAQDLTDRTHWLYRRIPGGSLQLTQAIPLTPFRVAEFSDDVAGWKTVTPTSDAINRYGLKQIDVSKAHRLALAVPVPFVSASTFQPRLKYIQLAVIGIGHSVVPATRPVITLYGQRYDAQESALGAATDPFTFLATYDSEHLITLNLDIPLDAYTEYYLQVRGETGTGAISGTGTGLYILGAFVAFQGS